MKHDNPTTELSSKYFRMRLWVDPHLQIPYLVSVLGFSVLTCGAVGALFYLFLSYTHHIFVAAILKILPNIPTLAEEYLGVFTQLLLREKSIVTWTYVVVPIIIGCGACLAGIILSHRYAGPIMNFRRIIRQITQKNQYHSLRLRRADEMRDLMDTFNQVTHHLKQKQAEDHSFLKRVHSLTTTAMSQPHVSEHDKQLLKEIQSLTQHSAA